jgi:uncharacterized membrane protein YkoI
MRFLSGLAAVAVLGLVVGTVTAAEEKEEKIPLSKVPKKVKQAVLKKFPKAKLVSAEKEMENKKLYYEIKIVYKKQTIEVLVTPGGKIVAEEKAIKVEDLPEAVTAALKKKYPGAKFLKAEEETKGKKKYFEVVVETKDKKKFEVVLTPDGKIVKPEGKDKKEKDED